MMIHHLYFEQTDSSISVARCFPHIGCSVFIGAELSNTAKIFTPSLWIEQTFKHVYFMTLVYCMYNKYVDSYNMLNFPFNKVNTLAPLFPIYGPI